MGIYARQDSPFWWLWLERAGQRALSESTRIPRQGATPEQTKELRQLAVAAYNARMADLARGRYALHVERPAISFLQFRTWYLQHVSPTKKSLARERSILKQLGKYFDTRRLGELTKEDGLEWRQARSQQVAPRTVDREMQLMKAVLNAAVPKYLASSPWARLPELGGDELEPKLLEPTEELRLLAGCTDEERALILCALDTLQRLGTVAALKWAQDHGAYLTVVRPKGRGRTTPYHVPVSTRLRKALDALPRSGPWVFPSYQASRVERRRVLVEEMFERRCREAEIVFGRANEGITFHSLRHTGASRMLNRGVDIRTVAEIGNWKDLAVLQKYLHPIGDARERAVEAVGARPRRRKRR